MKRSEIQYLTILTENTERCATVSAGDVKVSSYLSVNSDFKHNYQTLILSSVTVLQHPDNAEISQYALWFAVAMERSLLTDAPADATAG